MRFSPPTARARLAVLAGYEFPSPRYAGLYDVVDRVAAALPADVVFVHSSVADPATLPPGLRARLGEGLLAPSDPDVHADDVRHFERAAPARLQAFLELLARHGGVGVADVLARPEVREAISCARWAQGWSPSLVLSKGLDHGSFRALAIASLLGLPRVCVLADARYGDVYRNLLPLHVQQAAAVIVTHPFVRDELVTRFSADVLRKTVVWDPTSGDLQPLVTAVRQALARPAESGAPPLGPLAAFATDPRPPQRPATPRPFVVLGAERTGSNMLMAMLADRPAVACANELFNPRAIAEGQLSYLPQSALAAPDLLALRRRDPAGLQAQLGRDAAARGAVCHGWKLLYVHALVDGRVTDALVGDPHLAVVHLLRRDRVARWLSMQRALASDQWLGGRKAGDEQIVLPVAATALDFALHELLEARFRAVFAGQRSLELDYDDLVHRLPEVAERLGDFLGVDLRTMAPRTEKTGAPDIARQIANLDELRWAFDGTKWAGLIP